MKFIERWEQKHEFIARVFIIWLFGDVAFTILPIAIVWFIDASFGKSTNNLLLTPEFSFASIILYGLSIRSLIKLKTDSQRDFSHRLDGGTQLLTILLIFSVVCMCVVRISEHVASKIDILFLSTVQASLSFLSLVILFLCTYHTEKAKDEEDVD